MSPYRVLIVASMLILPMVAPRWAGAQSLWKEGVSAVSLFADHRARTVNDIVTILIVEQSSSSRTANTTTSKDTSRSASVNDFPTVLDPLARVTVKPLIGPLLGWQTPSQAAKSQFNIDLQSQASHTGKGSIDRTDKTTGQIPARVVKVLDNGNLMIEGRRVVIVNNETQILALSGVIRPQDVTSTNTVLSSQMADAEIQMTGRGLLAEAQNPGFFYRILDWLSLF
jgi:flagellar L-ring protein precursor FlgH